MLDRFLELLKLKDFSIHSDLKKELDRNFTLDRIKQVLEIKESLDKEINKECHNLHDEYKKKVSDQYGLAASLNELCVYLFKGRGLRIYSSYKKEIVYTKGSSESASFSSYTFCLMPPNFTERKQTHYLGIRPEDVTNDELENNYLLVRISNFTNNIDGSNLFDSYLDLSMCSSKMPRYFQLHYNVFMSFLLQGKIQFID
jgi:hypothetical protein